MLEWLQKLLRRPALTGVSLFALFIGIAWAVLGVFSVLSDIGFSTEVTKYRRWVLLTAAALGLLAVISYLYWFLYNQRNELRVENETLGQANQDLNEQKESAFRLMEKYKAEAQEDILNRLKQLATFSIHQHAWKRKPAKVERFRLDGPATDDEAIGLGDSWDRVTIIINLGTRDNVMKGMRFLVQDPTDLRKYGTIVVRECHEKGSACSIIDIEHPAFWAAVDEAVRSTDHRSAIIEAASNIIVPNSPFRELDADNAKQLLEWLQKLESVEF